MRKNLGIISVVLFFMGLVSWLPVYLGEDKYIEQSIISATAGVITGLFASKSTYKHLGLWGNSLILLCTVVVPFLLRL